MIPEVLKMPPQTTTEKQKASDDRSLKYGRRLANPKPGEEIVISGLSARFPSCKNAYEIRENLYKKLDFITGESRWIFENTAMPARVGMVPGAEFFDCSAFGMTPHIGDLADPVLRILLENVIEAIMDAGINPAELAGTRTALVGSVCNTETGEAWMKQNFIEDKNALLVASRSAANILSYLLKVNGPSIMADTACSSTAYCLDTAYKLLRNGECDNAIVFSASVIIDPRATCQFYSLGVLSPDGICKSFDASANGYVRSEAKCSVFMQKAKDAKRIYAQIVHCKTNCDGYKEEGITFPSGAAQQILLEEVYAESGIDPKDVLFVEAHGTGTKVGDPEELNAIDRVFCKNRKEPLLVGSVKANLGHTEPVAALSSLTKILLCMEAGYLAPNIHFNTPRSEVPAFKEGRLKVLLEKVPFNSENALIGINSYGFGGANGHILVRGFNKKKPRQDPGDLIPRLICVSGRSKAAVAKILKDVTERQLDQEYITLLHSVFRKSSSLIHPYRGFTIVSKRKVFNTVIQKQRFYTNKVIAVFSGLEDGWVVIGRELIKLDLFKNTLNRIDKILTKQHIDVIQSLLTIDPSVFTNKLLVNFVVQLGIIDILKAVGIRPTEILSVSLGKILAAYYQETITLEEALSTVLCFQSLITNGVASTNSSNGLQKTNHTNLKRTVSIHYHNSFNFDEKLSKNVLLPRLQKELKANGSHFDARELLNTTLTLEKLPKEGVIFEIGFGNFQEAVNSIKSDFLEIVNLPIDDIDGLVTFFDTLGRLYMLGIDLDLAKIHPPVQHPVSKGTPMISPLISWEHSLKEFKLKKYGIVEKNVKRTEMTVVIHVKSSEWNFITGHVIDGRILFPATGYLYVVWKELAELRGLTPEESKVVFENVRFKRATPITPTSIVEMLVTIFEGTGYFEINEGGTDIVTGYVKLLIHDVEMANLNLPFIDDADLPFKEQDVYKELKLRGYNYNGLFRGIKELNQDLRRGSVQWAKNWIAFMDNMLQLGILGNDTRNLYVPTAIDKIQVNGVQHMKYLEEFTEENPLLPVYVYHELNYCRSGFITIFGAKASPIPKRKALGEPILEKYQFVPNEASLTIDEAIRVNIQIALENHYRVKVKIVEVIDDDSEPLSPAIVKVLGDIPLMEPNVNIFTTKEFDYPDVTVQNKQLVAENDVFIVLGNNILSKPQILKDTLSAVKDGYILTLQTTGFNIDILDNNKLEILTSYKVEDDLLLLLRLVEEQTKKPTIIHIPSTLDDFSWLESLQNSLKTKQNVILVSKNETPNGILGLLNCIRREYKTLNTRCVFTLDEAPTFNAAADFYSKQLKKQFAVNVYKDGKWGTYRHLPLEVSSTVESQHAYVNALKRGDLSTLKWIEGPLRFDAGVETGKVFVQVYYASLNFRDVMTATGKLSADVITKYRPDQDCIQGIEFAGKDLSGNRVMGMMSGGALSTTVMADKDFLIAVPQHWSLEDAATIPVVYGTVLYALLVRARMKRGQSILIHAGSGGIGQAAIRIALHYGLDVYTTVGTETKRQFIKETFPEIKDHQIGNSRDTTFEQFIMKQTKGRGVDLVLNSLAEEKLQASVRCVARGGHFLEIGKFDLSMDNPLPLKCFVKGVSHHGVMLDAFFNQPAWIKRFVREEILKAIENGAVKPLHRSVFQKEQVEEAFRFMASGKHIGKVIIALRDEEEPPQITLTKCGPRYLCNPEYCQVILGGLGGFGLELADWLVLRGAKKLVLTSRTGVRNGYQASRIRLWRSYGVDVRVSTANTATRKGCTELIREASRLGPVESIFNLAVVLQDAILENQTEITFKTSFEPKAAATTYLDEITRKHCPYLRDFVVFSSVSCGRGNAGQTNYGMANSIMERICEKRKQDGLPGLAIQWGAIADVGLVAEMQRGDVEMEIGGTLQQRLTSCLNVLDHFLKQKEPVVSSMVVAEKRLGMDGTGNIVIAVANILGIKDLKTISLQATLAELGMDSMMSVEIKQRVETELDIVLSPQELRNLSFARLQELMEEGISGENKKSETTEGFSEFHTLILKSLESQDGSIPIVVPLTTLAQESCDVPLIALPGIEGTSALMVPLAAQLNRKVLCCQYVMEQQQTIEEIADVLLDKLRESFSSSNTFRLVCHSFGSSIAFEMACKLEAQGKEGKIVFVDGSPDMTKYLGKGLLDGDSYQAIENNFLFAIAGNNAPTESIPKIKEILSSSETYEEKVEKLFNILPQDGQPYREYLPKYMKTSIMRTYAFKTCKPPPQKVKADCVLCRAADSDLPENSIKEDYGLSEFLEKPLKIVDFSGNHVTVLENPELAKFVEEFLA